MHAFALVIPTAQVFVPSVYICIFTWIDMHVTILIQYEP